MSTTCATRSPAPEHHHRKLYTVHYDWDAAGRLKQITYSTGRTVGYLYDASGRPTRVTTQPTGGALVNLATDVVARPFDGRLVSFAHRNGLVEWRTYDNDGRISAYGVDQGSTHLLHRKLAYDDGINLAEAVDQLTPARTETYDYTDTNRLEDTTGPWGSEDFATDGVGNRTERKLISGGVTTTDIYALAPGTNRIASVTTNGSPSRAFTYDGPGNILTDTKGGVTTAYAYNKAGQPQSFTVGSAVHSPYFYNGFRQLASRQMTAGQPTSRIHMIYDLDGNLLAEANNDGVVQREYVWLAGRPIAVFDDASGTPISRYVHVDHLDRPLMMTNPGGASAWRAIYRPFGEVQQIIGAAMLDYRFPGQWFMPETGLHYNWHGWYDATTGRYTQPDPIGMPDGQSRYAYALNSPLMYVDTDALWVWAAAGAVIGGGADLGWQLYQTSGDWSCVNWAQVGGAALGGALLAPVGRFAWFGYEVKLGGNLRLAPFGNRRGIRSDGHLTITVVAHPTRPARPVQGKELVGTARGKGADMTQIGGTVSEVYILNESSLPDTPGDVRIFLSLKKLLEYVEPVDVRNQEYFAFDGSGRRLFLSAADDYGEIIANIEETPTHEDELKRLMQRYFERHSFEPAAQLATLTLEDLVRKAVQQEVRR